MKNLCFRITCLLVLGFPATNQAAGGRQIFLNGKDISTAVGQHLKGVEMRIDERGDVFITAPHYRVMQEDTYLPLSKYMEQLSMKHKPPHNIEDRENPKKKVIKNLPVQDPKLMHKPPVSLGKTIEDDSASKSASPELEDTASPASEVVPPAVESTEGQALPTTIPVEP